MAATRKGSGPYLLLQLHTDEGGKFEIRLEGKIVEIWMYHVVNLSCPLSVQICVSGPMSPPRNLTIYNHTDVSVWLSWEPPLEPNGVVIKYGFRIRDLITHAVTHRVPLISHTDNCSTITIGHTPTHTPQTHSVRVHMGGS